MSIAPIVLAQIGIMRKIHKSDSDCEKMSVAAVVLARTAITRKNMEAKPT